MLSTDIILFLYAISAYDTTYVSCCIRLCPNFFGSMRSLLLRNFGGARKHGDSDEVFARRAFVSMRMTISDGIPAPVRGFDYLFIGSVGSAYNSKALNDAGITHILCLSDVVELKFPDRFTYLRVALEDKPDEDIAAVFQQCFEFIDTVKSSGGKCLVHCYQGISRSVAIVIAYLVTHYKMSVDDSLQRIRETRAVACPNIGFMVALRALEQQSYL
jgi:dual specificity protein phosphatase 1B